MIQKAVFNWSSGKDSAFALYKALQNDNLDISCLLTTLNKKYERVSMHGVDIELLKLQAESIGIPLKIIELSEAPTMEEYENAMQQTMDELQENGIEISIFGDIFLEDLKKYRENKLAKSNMYGYFPLWNIPTKQLIREFIDLGFQAIVCCVNEQFLDKSFSGRIIDNDFLKDLPENVDPCGENGEYHSFVFDGPIFKCPIKIKTGNLLCVQYPSPKNIDGYEPNNENVKNNLWYCDLKIEKL